MLLAVIISYAEKIVNRKAVPFGAAFFFVFLRRGSPKRISRGIVSYSAFLPEFWRRREKAPLCSNPHFRSLSGFRRCPFLSPGIKKKPFPLPLPRLWRPLSGAAAYSFYKPLFCPILYYIDITVPKMSWLAVPILSPCRSLFVTSKLPF